jgi:hypothetical protein
MNSTLTTQPLDEVRKSEKTVLGGSLAEGIASGAAVVLALIGLAGIMPETMLPVAVIVMGAAFLLEGGAISMRFSKLLTETSTSRFDEAELGVGVTSEFLGRSNPRNTFTPEDCPDDSCACSGYRVRIHTHAE